MKLQGVDFGCVFNASGARGFFGEGYAYHAAWKMAGLTYEGCTFVAKTTTLNPRLDPKNKLGNMPLKRDGITPKELIPKCIKVNPLKSVVLNAVGLSGPGAQALLDDGRWQERREPFFLSFMSVEKEPGERLVELEKFVSLLYPYLKGDTSKRFKAPVALEINLSCPNVGLDPGHLVEEAEQAFEVANKLGIPVVAKVNALLNPEAAREIGKNRLCSALCGSNTISWGQLPDRIDWEDLFGSEESPLKQYGGGGLSGAPLLPIVEEWVRDLRKTGYDKPLIAGGGILKPADARTLLRAGADAVSLGVIGMLRPWNMKRTIRAAHRYFE
jgi:dihydroorotate dehydrogenase